MVDPRDRSDAPLDAENIDLYDDDWVPPEMFGPTRGDTVAAPEPVTSSDLPAAADDIDENDLLLPQMSELWPADPSPASSADVTERLDDDRITAPTNAQPADSIAASMLQTAESFIASLPQIEPLPAEPQKPAPSIATPVPPAEPLTALPTPPATRNTPPIEHSAGYRPWVAEGTSEPPAAVRTPPAPQAQPNVPVKTLPLAPPIPPLRYEPPNADAVAPPRPTTGRAEATGAAESSRDSRSVSAEPPVRTSTTRASRPETAVRMSQWDAAHAEATARSASPPARRIQDAQPRAPQPRIQPQEPRPARLPRQAVSVQPAVESTEPLAAVKRSLSVLEKLLAMTTSRGASTLYLAPNARPTIRIHGEVYALDGTSVFARQDVETLLRSLMLAQQQDALPPAGGAEWFFDVPAVGHVRCMTFRDHRGPGAVFRIGPRRAVAAEQLGLSMEIQSLALERDGLVLVAGQRSSGKGAVVAGLLDLINRTRRAYVITVEREVNVSPDRDGSFISQREVRGGLEEMVAVARAALRENPDVLVLQELRSAPLVNLAFDAAASGQLVIAGFTAPSAGGAIDRIIKLYPRESARAVQLLLAQHLRAVVSQVLVPKVGGGRVAAREVLLNTSAVASALADGKAWEVPGAIEAGRKHGMVPFSDALAALVQSGAAAADEAYRHAPDRAGFLEALKRHGIDPSSAVRFS
jgi:twitching motility protein PilT